MSRDQETELSAVADRTAPAPRWRRALIVAALSLVSAGAVFGLTQLRFHDDTDVLFKSSDSQHELLRMLAEDFGLEEDNYFIVVNGGDLFTPEGVGAVRRIAREVEQLDGVVSVDSIVDVPLFDDGFMAVTLLPEPSDPPEAYQRARRDALAHPMIPSQVLSLDGRTTLLIVRFDPRPDSVARIERAVGQLRDIARQATANSGLSARVTGIPPIRAKIMRDVIRDDVLYSGLSVLLIAALAALLFRRAGILMVLFSVPSLTILWTMGTVGLSGVSLNVLNIALPAMLLTIGMFSAAYSLAGLRQGPGWGGGLVAVTLAAGFASMMFVDAQAIRDYGMFAGAGALFCGVALLAVAGLRRREPLVASAPDVTSGNGRLFRFPWPAVTALLGVGVMVVAAVSGGRLRPEYLLTDTLPKTSEEYQALGQIEESFNGAGSVYAVLEWPESERFASRNVLLALRDMQRALENDPATHGSLSIIDYLRCYPKSTGGLIGRARLLWLGSGEGRYVAQRFVRVDRRRTLARARIDPSEAASFDELQQRLAGVQEDYPELHIRLTGFPVMNRRVLDRLAADLRVCLLGSAGLLFLVATLAFRSIVLGLIGAFCGLFPPLVTAASLAWMGRPLDFVGILLCISAWGIGTTHALHMLARYREELRAGGGSADAVRRALRATAPMVASVTALLIAGSLCLLPSELPALRLFGVLSVVALVSGLISGLGNLAVDVVVSSRFS